MDTWGSKLAINTYAASSQQLAKIDRKGAAQKKSKHNRKQSNQYEVGKSKQSCLTGHIHTWLERRELGILL